MGSTFFYICFLDTSIFLFSRGCSPLPHIAFSFWVHGCTGGTFEDLGKMLGVLDSAVDAPLGRCVGVSAELSK